MAINKLVKFHLESQAVKLREKGKTFDDIARILSEDSQQNISKSNVFRFFDAYEKSKAEIIERQEPLKVKYIEAEISTIEDRQTIIRGLIRLAETAEDERARALAFKYANDAVDSLDRRMGKITNNPNVQINNINAMKLEEVPKDQLSRWMDEIRSLRAR